MKQIGCRCRQNTRKIVIETVITKVWRGCVQGKKISGGIGKKAEFIRELICRQKVKGPVGTAIIFAAYKFNKSTGG